MFGNEKSHAAYWACTGDQNVFSSEIPGKRGVNGVSEGIETGHNFIGNRGIGEPDIGFRDGYEFSKSAIAFDTDTESIGAEMAFSTTAVFAFTTDDMAFSRNTVSRLELGDVSANFLDDTDEFMADNTRRFDGRLGPGIPFIDMEIGSTDRGMGDFDKDVVRAYLGDRGVDG